MILRRQQPKNNRYKFYNANLWGKIFLTKPFREKDVLFARFSRRSTLKALDVNPVKLRQKRFVYVGSRLAYEVFVKEVLL